MGTPEPTLGTRRRKKGGILLCFEYKEKRVFRWAGACRRRAVAQDCKRSEYEGKIPETGGSHVLCASATTWRGRWRTPRKRVVRDEVFL